MLRGSTPQQGIYPGGGLDPRIDPRLNIIFIPIVIPNSFSLVPVARGQLADEFRILHDQLEILTRRLGVGGGGRRRSS